MSEASNGLATINKFDEPGIALQDRIFASIETWLEKAAPVICGLGGGYDKMFITCLDFLLDKQVFIKEDCQNTTDLKFQFGVLEVGQLQKLQDMDRKIAVSVRTDYDAVTLRGKGFIYVSSEKGPLALSGCRVEKNPWSMSNGLLTELVLLHELGHVFGLRHDSKIPLMQEDYVEFVAAPGVFAYLKDQDIEKGMMSCFFSKSAGHF